MTERVANEVIAVIARKLEIPADQIHLDDDLVVDLGADSLALAELSMLIEQQLQAKLSVDEMIDVTTVGDMVALLERGR
jgi:acyl carrier protein